MTRGAIQGSQQKRGRVTRQRLIDATIETLTERGYAATSMPELCKRAGLSRGAQLHHFPTKALLLAAAVEELMQRHQGALRDLLLKLPEDARVDAFVDELWRIYSGPTFYAFLELAVAARSDNELRAPLQAVNDRFYAEAHETLRKLLPLSPEHEAMLPALARFVTSFMDGVAVNRILDDDDRLTEATLALFKQTVHGFLAMFTRGQGEP